MNETKLARLEHDTLLLECSRRNLPMKFQRIESHATGQGTADVYCCVDGISFWVENKIWPNAPTQLQWGFLYELAAAGGKGFVCTHGGNTNKIEILQVLNERVVSHYITEDAVGLKLLQLIGK
jgi:hypothetical protein